MSIRLILSLLVLGLVTTISLSSFAQQTKSAESEAKFEGVFAQGSADLLKVQMPILSTLGRLDFCEKDELIKQIEDKKIIYLLTSDHFKKSILDPKLSRRSANDFMSMTEGIIDGFAEKYTRLNEEGQIDQKVFCDAGEKNAAELLKFESYEGANEFTADFEKIQSYIPSVKEKFRRSTIRLGVLNNCGNKELYDRYYEFVDYESALMNMIKNDDQLKSYEQDDQLYYYNLLATFLAGSALPEILELATMLTTQELQQEYCAQMAQFVAKDMSPE